MHKHEKSLWLAVHPVDYWSTFYSPKSFSALEIENTCLQNTLAQRQHSNKQRGLITATYDK